MDCNVQQHDFRIVSGDTRPPFEIIYAQADGETPVDLTGWTITMEIAWVGESINLAVGSGLVIDPEAGSIVATLTEAQSLSLPTGKIAKYEIQATSPDGGIETILLGFIQAVAGI